MRYSIQNPPKSTLPLRRKIEPDLKTKQTLRSFNSEHTPDSTFYPASLEKVALNRIGWGFMGRKCAKSIHPRKQGRRFVIHPIMIPLPLQCLLSPTNHQPNVFHRQFGSHPRQILAQRTHLISRCKPLFPDRELGGILVVMGRVSLLRSSQRAGSDGHCQGGVHIYSSESLRELGAQSQHKRHFVPLHRCSVCQNHGHILTIASDSCGGSFCPQLIPHAESVQRMRPRVVWTNQSTVTR